MNSEAIIRHCQELGHSFTPLQAAWIINQSCRHTYEEKHRAYRWVSGLLSGLDSPREGLAL